MSRRRSIDVPGLAHGAMPIPNASLIGPFLFTGGISGTGEETADDPAREVELQVERMFANVDAVVRAAGGTLDDVVHMRIFVRDRAYREAINPHWVAAFPDPESRPARHTLIYDLPGRMLVQCEVVAVLQAPKETP